MAIDIKEYVGSKPTFIKTEQKEAKAKNNKENKKDTKCKK